MTQCISASEPKSSMAKQLAPTKVPAGTPSCHSFRRGVVAPSQTCTFFRRPSTVTIATTIQNAISRKPCSSFFSFKKCSLDLGYILARLFLPFALSLSHFASCLLNYAFPQNNYKAHVTRRLIFNQSDAFETLR